jgi:hypothetical protein
VTFTVEYSNFVFNRHSVAILVSRNNLLVNDVLVLKFCYFMDNSDSDGRKIFFDDSGDRENASPGKFQLNDCYFDHNPFDKGLTFLNSTTRCPVGSDFTPLALTRFCRSSPSLPFVITDFVSPTDFAVHSAKFLSSPFSRSVVFARTDSMRVVVAVDPGVVFRRPPRVPRNH